MASYTTKNQNHMASSLPIQDDDDDDDVNSIEKNFSNKKANESLWQAFKNEFKWENFSLNFEKNSEFRQNEPQDILKCFHSSIWPCCNRFVYLVYRIGIAIYYTIWLIESIVRNHEFRQNNYQFVTKNGSNLFEMHPWPFYMTSWSLTALFLHLWIAAFIVLYFYSINEKSALAKLFTHLFSMTNFSCCESSIPSNDGTDVNLKRASASSINIVYFDVNKLNSEHPLQQTDESQTETIKIEANKQSSLIRERKPVNKSSFKYIKCFNCNCMSSKSMYKVVNQSDCCLIKVKANDEDVMKISDGRHVPLLDTVNVPSDKIKNEHYLILDDHEAWSLWLNSHVPYFILVLIKISWLLYNLIAIAAIFVTIGYFSYVYIADLDMRHTWLMELGNLHRHGFNSIVAIIDVLILAYPVRIHHHIYTNLYGWLYALVIFMYWLLDTENNIVYEIIDYNKPFRILLMYSFMTLLTFIMQILHFIVYRLKLSLRDKLVNICFQEKNEFCMSRPHSPSLASSSSSHPKRRQPGQQPQQKEANKNADLLKNQPNGELRLDMELNELPSTSPSSS